MSRESTWRQTFDLSPFSNSAIFSCSDNDFDFFLNCLLKDFIKKKDLVYWRLFCWKRYSYYPYRLAQRYKEVSLTVNKRIC